MCVVCRQSERQRACSSYKVLCVLEVYHVLFVCLVLCVVLWVFVCVLCVYICVWCVCIYIYIYIYVVFRESGRQWGTLVVQSTKYTYSYIHIHKRREWFAFFSGCCCCCMFVHVCVCFCVFIVATRANYWDGRFVSLIRACRTWRRSSANGRGMAGAWSGAHTPPHAPATSRHPARSTRLNCVR